MTYRIEYGPSLPQRKLSFPLRLVGLTCLFFVLFLVGVNIFWPEGRETLIQLLLPAGHATHFIKASQGFFNSLTAGQPFYESLTAFCREIISYAELPAA